MGGNRLSKQEKGTLAQINNFFILEYVKRKMFLDENQRGILCAWRNILSKIIGILRSGTYFDDADVHTYTHLINFFKNKQPITEEEYYAWCMPFEAISSDERNLLREKLNDELNNFNPPEINQIEGLKYYDLYYLIRDIDIADRIKRWDRSLLVKNSTSIQDEKGNELKLDRNTYGNKCGLHLVDGDGSDGKITIFFNFDPVLHESPIPNDPRINFINSSDHEIKIDGKILKNKSVLVLNSDYIYGEKGALLEILNQSNVERLYIKRFDSVLTRLLALYIWDKVNFTKTSLETAVKNVTIDDELKISVSGTRSEELLKTEYQVTRKNIENIFKDLPKAFPQPLTFGSLRRLQKKKQRGRETEI